jgi:ketosteroid isomerase-like protein
MFTSNRYSHRTLISTMTAIAIAATFPFAVAAETDGASRSERNGCSAAIENRNLANFKAYLSALLSGDFATANSYFATGGVVEVHGASLPFAGTYNATNGDYAALQLQYWDFSNAGTPAAPTLYADCDKVILKGPFQRTAKATGKPIDTTVIEFFTFNREGRIVRDDFYFTDTATVKSVLGLP